MGLLHVFARIFSSGTVIEDVSVSLVVCVSLSQTLCVSEQAGFCQAGYGKGDPGGLSSKRDGLLLQGDSDTHPNALTLPGQSR